MEKIHRRSLLKLAAAAGAGAGAAALAGPALASGTVEWRLVTSWPKGAPGVGVSAQRFADAVGALSGGRMTVRLFAAGELAPPFEVFDTVALGNAECGHTTPYYASGKNPAANFFTTVPFGLNAVEHEAWLKFGGGQQLWEKLYAPFDVLPFYAGNSGIQAAGWFRKPINSLQDLAGLKMRIAGLGGEAMRRIGVNPVLMPPGEIFPAMSSGAVDAAEWIGPWNDLAFGLFKVAKYYYMPAFHEPGAGLEVIVNRKAYDALPQDLQQIVAAAAAVASANTLCDFAYHNAMALPEVAAKEGVVIGKLPEDVIGALAVSAREVVAELAAKDALSGEIYASYKAFLDKAIPYSRAMDSQMLADRQRAHSA